MRVEFLKILSKGLRFLEWLSGNTKIRIAVAAITLSFLSLGVLSALYVYKHNRFKILKKLEYKTFSAIVDSKIVEYLMRYT